MTVPMGLLLLADTRFPAGGHGHSGGVEALVDRGLLTTTDDLAAFLAARVRTAAAVPAAAAAAACTLAAGRGPGGDSPDSWAAWDAAVSVRMPSAALREASRAQGGALLRTARTAWSSPALAALAGLRRPHHALVLGVAATAAGAGAGVVGARAEPGGAARPDRAVAAAGVRPEEAGSAAGTRRGEVVASAGSRPEEAAADMPGAPAGARSAGAAAAGSAARLEVVAASAGTRPEEAAALAVHHLIGGACTAAVRLLGLDPLRVAAIAAAEAGDPTRLPTDGNPLADVLAELHHRAEATLFAS